MNNNTMLCVQIRMIETERYSKDFKLAGWDLRQHSCISNGLIGTLLDADSATATGKLIELKRLVGGNYIQIGYCFKGILPKGDLLRLYGFKEHPNGFMKKEVSGYSVSALPCDAAGYWTLNIMNRIRNVGIDNSALSPNAYLEPVLSFDYGNEGVAV